MFETVILRSMDVMANFYIYMLLIERLGKNRGIFRVGKHWVCPERRRRPAAPVSALVRSMKTKITSLRLQRH